MIRVKHFIILYFIVFTAIYCETVTTVIVPQKENINDHRNDYYIELLQLAMEKTKSSYGDFKIKESSAFMLQGRVLRELSLGSNLVDLTWTMTSREREDSTSVVRIPLLKGLLGYRIFIINKKDKDKFEAIKNESDLKKLTAGQGHDWPDLKILAANGYKTYAASNYDGLFKMVSLKRIDYFPRGVNEPFNELKSRTELGLTIDEHLMLYYPAPIFFFVNKSKPELAKRIEEGLEIAIKDGSFDKLFFNHPSNKEVFSQAKLKDRLLFKLDNPLLSEETKKILTRKELFYQP